MSSDERRFGRQPNPNPGQENEADGDDEFGDFEGFEGAALESIPAAAGPSPWATFPDLLPVQTSPAASGIDEPGTLATARASEPREGVEPWLAVAGSSSQRLAAEMLPSIAHDGVHGMFGQPRTINPPDVSLGAYPPPTYNSVVEQACGSVSAHGVDESVPELGSQLVTLQRQMDAVSQQKHQLQLQLQQLLREKQQLQQQLSLNQAETANLRTQLVELQQQLANLSNRGSSASTQELLSTLQQIQDFVAQASDTQVKETHGLREAVSETRSHIDEKTAALEKQFLELSSKLEQNHLHPVENSGHLESVVVNVVQECFKQNLDSLAQTVASSLSEMIRNKISPNQDGVVQNFRAELQRHVDQTRRLLERERQQHLLSLAQALQAALKQVSATIEPTLNDHNEAGGDENS